MQAHVDLRRLEPLLQIVIDRLVADCGQQSHVTDSDLLLFEGLLPIGFDHGLSPSTISTGKLGRSSRLGSLLSGSLGDSL